MAHRRGRLDPGRALPRGALLLLCAAALACGEARRPPDVILLSVDTLRADHLGAYGADTADTPGIDRLAREGTLFERAAAPMPLTRPTHASLLTGLYPREHGVVNNTLALPDDSATLPEILAARGWRTAAFVSVSLLSDEAGFRQGFEVFEHPTRPRSRPAADAVDAALGWLGGLGPHEPYFLWVHLFDPHLPYAPPHHYLREGDPALLEKLPGLSWQVLERVARENDGNVPVEVLAHARALYRGEVAYTDRQVARLLQGVAARRPLDEALVVFTADHGECFERGVYFEHADCLHDSALRVPLIVRYPPVFAAGRRVGVQASSVDVLPTVLRSLGLAPPEGTSGRALQDLAPDAERYVLVQHPLYEPDGARDRGERQRVIRSVAGDPIAPLLVGSQRLGVVGGGWKLLRDDAGDELFALGERDETRAPAEGSVELRARLGDELARLLAAHPLRVLDAGEINAELRATLEALGYLESDGEAPGPEGAPDEDPD